MSDPFIPPATLDKLSSHHPEGTRHNAAMQIAYSLVGQGLPGTAVLATLKEKFSNMPERELENIVSWSQRQSPKPCNGERGAYQRPYGGTYTPPKQPERSPAEQAEWWICGARMTADEMASKSPIVIPIEPKDYCALAVQSLYQEDDFLNVVCQFTMNGPKANPLGAGKTLKRDMWAWWVNTRGVPESDAGAWFRLNPCNQEGTGKEGAYQDADVARFPYVLVESDILPINVQIALIYRLKLPVVAVVLSGGKSAQAWVRLNCDTSDHFKEMARQLLEALKPFGIDQANKNPSRLCRFPGAKRVIGASDDGIQRVIWLNPNVTALTKDGLEQFRLSLQFTAVEEYPLKAIARSSIDRWQFASENKGKLGVPTGIHDLNKISGGWKRGQTIVIAGETGGGKSTVGLHCIRTALHAGYGVCLFSLEMDREEIFDLLMSAEANVNRNAFNTGGFGMSHDPECDDMAKLKETIKTVSEYPLFIEDSSMTTVDQVRARVLQLCADNRIGLVVVDYIQFINPGITRDNREQQVAAFSHALRALAREVKLPFIVLSQLNDEGRLRESRVISHNANIVIMVSIQDKNVKLEVVKGRGIPLGTYYLDFDRNFARLSDTNNGIPQDAGIKPRKDSYGDEC